MGETPESLPAVPHGAPDRARRRFLRPFLLALVVLALAASVVCNAILYRRADSNYRSLSEVRLDPYGLKHPDFPPDPAPAEAQSPLVVFYGDSRARQWPSPRVSEWRFVNRGVGGQTTEQLRGRFDAHVTPLSPRVVVVQGGINDLKAIPLFPGRRDEIVADCKANLQEVVRRARAGGAVVVVTTPPAPSLSNAVRFGHRRSSARWRRSMPFCAAWRPTALSSSTRGNSWATGAACAATTPPTRCT